MPTVSSRRSLSASHDRVWRLVSDPYNLPRWWPETVRVESVEGRPGAKRSRFTQVLETPRGKPVRADFKCVAATEGRRLVWSQLIPGTPFEKFLRTSELEVEMEPRGAETEVQLTGRRELRGMSRLGAPMMTRATRRMLDSALDGIASAVEDEDEA